MASTKAPAWSDIQPGDIGFSAGGGVVGLIIKLGSLSSWAHTYVYHKPLGMRLVVHKRTLRDLLFGRPSTTEWAVAWKTVESNPAFGKRDGVQWGVRTSHPQKVTRIWRTSQEQDRLLDASEAMIGEHYGWGEIFRIALHGVGIKVRRKDNNHSAICSKHASTAALASRPDLANFIEYPPYAIWPGYLAVALDRLRWEDDRQRDILVRKIRNSKK